ncbi:hypothetical protein HBB16_04245 [Pseudonocardia sp. MCCB 268]|nr:hypothetical protein [Pseudonocardia cytotoxica]
MTTLPRDRDPRWIINWPDGLRHRRASRAGPGDGYCSSYRDPPVYWCGVGSLLAQPTSHRVGPTRS